MEYFEQNEQEIKTPTNELVEMVEPDGDGYKTVELVDRPVEEIRGPKLQDWIDREMPHSD